MAADRRGLPRPRISRRGDPHRSRPHHQTHKERDMQNGTTAIISRNGSHPEPVAVEEHDLLWDGLPPATKAKLGEPLDEGLVSHRKGRGGRTFAYLEGRAAIDQANRIFGFGGWGYELAAPVELRESESVDAKTGETRRFRAYAATVRVTVPGSPSRTDVGFHAVVEETAEGHETAYKGAVTDALKRACGATASSSGTASTATPRPATPLPPCAARSSSWGASRASTRARYGTPCAAARARTSTSCPSPKSRASSSPWPGSSRPPPRRTSRRPPDRYAPTPPQGSAQHGVDSSGLAPRSIPPGCGLSATPIHDANHHHQEEIPKCHERSIESNCWAASGPTPRCATARAGPPLPR